MKNYCILALSFTLVALCSLHKTAAQTVNTYQPQFGIFENQVNIGDPAMDGNVAYDTKAQQYTITGSGTNIWGQKDEFQYLYQSIQGDFILRARVKFLGENGDPHRKIGWSIRDNLNGDTKHVSAAIHADGLTSLQYRKETGGNTEEFKSTDSLPDVIQLERRGDTYYMATAKWGEPLTTVEIGNIGLRNEVFVGLFVCAHDASATAKAVFQNVRIIKPMPEDGVPYQDYLGSRVEIMDVDSGQRKILFQSAHSLQAPNWVNDDKELVYNSNGFLYRYTFDTNTVHQVETGFATHNNNDHVFSFDEKLLGISNHNPEDKGNSSIYLMDSKGDSLPRKITKDGVGNSYLHSISPDKETLLFTGFRNDKFDIHSINVNTQKETQLTDTEGLDDGSEYAPDGKSIYFNSNRTGAMQLWRMDADGGNPEQLTFDKNYNDWFPHISPDRKWIAFISFSKDVPSDDHPFYKQCTLRLMPVSGGEPKIIAYIYGGQGTINVPSWSSDSKHIAFVTNSD
ncbi:MAG TPA: biopolymer transporter TolR [Leeuwenhoekiella sp.]|nr:biopolymer transporter TolR [Leeuwenhoekiella sp.]